MKKFVCIISVCLLLTGCSAKETFEVISDGYEPHTAEPRQVICALPDDATAQTIQSDYGQLYFCDGYEIALQTMPSGDVDKTLRELTGFGKDDITVIQTGTENSARYDFVWTAAGEGGDMVGRAAVLDDGNYHYCMTVMASQENAAKLRQTWKSLFESFILG